MLSLQLLSCLFLGVSLTAAQNVCLDDRSTFIDPGTKASVPCTENAAGDVMCEGKSPGYLCTPGTQGSAICCGIPLKCSSGFIAKYDRNIGEFATCPTVMDFECTHVLGPAYKCQNGYCCTQAQKAPENCDSTNQVAVNNQCLPKKSLGDSCKAVEQCPPGAVCQITCVCAAGFLENSARTECNRGCKTGEVQIIDRCYPLLNPNSLYCYYPQQCIGGSICTNYICQCPKTLPNVVNNVCTAENPTTTTSTITTTTPPPSTANCKTTEVQIINQCYPQLSPNGFYCYFSQQCTGGSTCTNYICQCPKTLPNIVNNVCTAGTGTCTGNTVSITGKGCVTKTTDGVCLNVNCLSAGVVACSAYAPYTKCLFNGQGQGSYFCCP